MGVPKPDFHKTKNSVGTIDSQTRIFFGYVYPIIGIPPRNGIHGKLGRRMHELFIALIVFATQLHQTGDRMSPLHVFVFADEVCL